MSSETDYRLIYKKWYFWIPLVLMGIAYYTWIIILLCDFSTNRGYVSVLMLFFLIVNTYFLFFSYFFIKKIVHRICGILMMVLLILLYIFCRIYEIDMLYLFGFDTLLLNLLSGLILIGMSLIKINQNQTDKNKLQSNTANQSKNIQSYYKLISQKWYFWIPLVMTLIAAIPWMFVLLSIILSNNVFLTNIMTFLLIFYVALLVGVYMFISRCVHLLCGILMIVLAIGSIFIGDKRIMIDSQILWFSGGFISILFNFISGVLLVAFSIFYHSK